MKILITGADGFVGRNLRTALQNQADDAAPELFLYDLDTPPGQLDAWCGTCDFVCHLAGVNRPKDPAEFMAGNFGFTSELLDALKKHGNRAPVLIASSIHAARSDSAYGVSKKAGEDLIFEYGRTTGIPTYVFRLANLFGKWCRPHYNSVVATFCHNVTHGRPIEIHDPSAEVPFVYIDDVVAAFTDAIEGRRAALPYGQYQTVEPVYPVTIGRLAALLQSFRDSRALRSVPDLSDGFEKKLYSTYLSYLRPDDFGYDLETHADARGSFTEFLRTPDRGQVSVNVARPGVVKGNHWHHTKNEKFLVVSGEAVIRFRKLDEAEVIEYRVSGSSLRVLDIPPGYTHNIENIGDTDLVTVMWANEAFNPEQPDTFMLPV